MTNLDRRSVSDVGEAKRWIEVATALARLVQNSEAVSEKVCLFEPGA